MFMMEEGLGMGLTNPESFRLQPSVMGVFCCRFCMGRPSKEVADSISSGARGGQLIHSSWRPRTDHNRQVL